jgi:hypothetical protein
MLHVEQMSEDGIVVAHENGERSKFDIVDDAAGRRVLGNGNRDARQFAEDEARKAMLID